MPVPLGRLAVAGLLVAGLVAPAAALSDEQRLFLDHPTAGRRPGETLIACLERIRAIGRDLGLPTVQVNGAAAMYCSRADSHPRFRAPQARTADPRIADARTRVSPLLQDPWAGGSGRNFAVYQPGARGGRPAFTQSQSTRRTFSAAPPLMRPAEGSERLSAAERFARQAQRSQQRPNRGFLDSLESGGATILSTLTSLTARAADSGAWSRGFASVRETLDPRYAWARAHAPGRAPPTRQEEARLTAEMMVPGLRSTRAALGFVKTMWDSAASHLERTVMGGYRCVTGQGGWHCGESLQAGSLFAVDATGIGALRSGAARSALSERMLAAADELPIIAGIQIVRHPSGVRIAPMTSAAELERFALALGAESRVMVTGASGGAGAGYVERVVALLRGDMRRGREAIVTSHSVGGVDGAGRLFAQQTGRPAVLASADELMEWGDAGVRDVVAVFPDQQAYQAAQVAIANRLVAFPGGPGSLADVLGAVERGIPVTIHRMDDVPLFSMGGNGARRLSNSLRMMEERFDAFRRGAPLPHDEFAGRFSREFMAEHRTALERMFPQAGSSLGS